MNDKGKSGNISFGDTAFMPKEEITGNCYQEPSDIYRYPK